MKTGIILSMVVQSLQNSDQPQMIKQEIQDEKNLKLLLITIILGSGGVFTWYPLRLCQHWWSVGVMWLFRGRLTYVTWQQGVVDWEELVSALVTIKGPDLVLIWMDFRTPLSNYLLSLSKILISLWSLMLVFNRMLTYRWWRSLVFIESLF